MNMRIPGRRRAGAAFLAITVTVAAQAVASPALAASATRLRLGALHSVAAVSARDAWAVGYSGRGNRTQVLVEHWNGSAWKRVPHPAGVMTGDLSGVTATSSDNVWAVGSGRANEPLILHWNGRSWRNVVVKDLPTKATLYSASAVSARCAWIVGFNGARALILQWNGKSWRRAPIRANARDGMLWEVKAVSSRLAWAVGTPGVLLRWNGSVWANTRHPIADDLYGVGSSARLAVTVGDVGPAGRPIIQVWNGTDWISQHVPAIPGGAGLYGAAATGSRAWAVGSYGPNANIPLILARNDRGAWTKMSIARTIKAVLYRAAAASPRDAWAVGATSLDDPSSPVALLWNGSAWRAVPVPV